MNNKSLLKDVVIIPALAAILYVQQLALAFIPNVQLTTLLILLYTKVLGFKRSSLIMILHFFAYNFLNPYGPVLPTHLPFFVIAWLIFIVASSLSNNTYVLATIGFIFGFVYGFILSIPAVFLTGIPFVPYIISDIPFQIIMAISNFVTILWLYERLKVVLSDLMDQVYLDNTK